MTTNIDYPANRIRTQSGEKIKEGNDIGDNRHNLLVFETIKSNMHYTDGQRRGNWIAAS